MNTIIQMMFLLSKKIKGFVRKITSPFPITCPDCVDEDSLINMSIEGNCYQDGEPTYDNPIEIQSVGERTANKLVYPYLETTKTINGVTFTDKGDGIITANGTANATTSFPLATIKGITDITQKYYLFGAPIGGSYYICIMVYYYYNNKYVGEQYDKGGGLLIDLSSLDYEVDELRFYVRVGNGRTVDNLVFKPMLIEADTEVDGYEPYGYKIPIVATSNDGSKSIATNIYLKEPLRGIKKDFVIGATDTIDIKNGLCVRNIKETDVEIYALSSSGNIGIINSAKIGKIKNQDAGIMCEKATQVPTVSTKKEGDLYENSANICIKGSADDTLETLKAKYDGSKIVYVLAEPITEKIIAPNIPTFKNGTTYSIATTVQPLSGTVEYYSTTKGE